MAAPRPTAPALRRPRGRNLNRVIQQYWDAMVEATKDKNIFESGDYANTYADSNTNTNSEPVADSNAKSVAYTDAGSNSAGGNL